MTNYFWIHEIAEKTGIHQLRIRRYLNLFPELIETSQISETRKKVAESSIPTLIQIDELYRKNLGIKSQKDRVETIKKILSGNSVSLFAVGFLWGSSRITNNESVLVQNQNLVILKKVKNILNPALTIYEVRTPKDKSYRFKLSINHPYVQWMLRNGYEGRIGNIDRDMPTFRRVQDEAEFFRGYFSVHFSYSPNRLRFFGSRNILERLNQHLSDQLGCGIKKIQKHHQNEVCHILYYQSQKEIPEIIKYLQLPIN